MPQASRAAIRLPQSAASHLQSGHLSALTAACDLLKMRLLLRRRSSKELFKRICARGGATRVSPSAH